MSSHSSVFERTYEGYLARIKKIDFKRLEKILGLEFTGTHIKISLLGTPYIVSGKGIVDAGGDKPSLDVCVVLSKYLLMCPEEIPAGKNWASYRDFKDTGPLAVYFENEIERAIAIHFEEDLAGLRRSCTAVGGYQPCVEFPYDAAFQFDALPQISLLLLFNDKDEEFPSSCTLLYTESAERYLDGECLAILGRLLFEKLREK